MNEKKFSVPAINCGHCTRTIEMELGDMDGVTAVKADVTSKMVTVNWDAPATWDGIVELLEEIEFSPQL